MSPRLRKIILMCGIAIPIGFLLYVIWFTYTYSGQYTSSAPAVLASARRLTASAVRKHHNGYLLQIIDKPDASLLTSAIGQPLDYRVSLIGPGFSLQPNAELTGTAANAATEEIASSVQTSLKQLGYKLGTPATRMYTSGTTEEIPFTNAKGTVTCSLVTRDVSVTCINTNEVVAASIELLPYMSALQRGTGIDQMSAYKLDSNAYTSTASPNGYQLAQIYAFPSSRIIFYRSNENEQWRASPVEFSTKGLNACATIMADPDTARALEGLEQCYTTNPSEPALLQL